MERDKLSVKIHDNKYEINYTNNLKTLQKKLLPIIKKEYKGIETISFDNLYLLYKDKDEDLISIADDNDYNLYLQENKETCLQIEEIKDFDDINEIGEFEQ
jgi:hypothetical protein